MIAVVPQLVPVQKAMNEDTRNTSGKTARGWVTSPRAEATVAPVLSPAGPQRFPMARAITMRLARGSSSPALAKQVSSSESTAPFRLIKARTEAPVKDPLPATLRPDPQNRRLGRVKPDVVPSAPFV